MQYLIRLAVALLIGLALAELTVACFGADFRARSSSMSCAPHAADPFLFAARNSACARA